MRTIVAACLIVLLLLPGRQASFAGDRAGASDSDPLAGMEFVEVKGGCFQMGDVFSSGEANERPVHDACVQDFSIGKREVTQAEWQAVMGINPSEFKACGPDCPVENVSWNDAQEFIAKLNAQTGKTYRFPTEAEWEYAARSGGKKEQWSGTSSEADLAEYAWYDKKQSIGTAVSGKRKPNGLGILDMTGNVNEWVQDWYDPAYFASAPKDDPTGPAKGKQRVLRGGSWDAAAKYIRATSRYKADPSTKNSGRGLRLALGAQTVPAAAAANNAGAVRCLDAQACKEPVAAMGLDMVRDFGAAPSWADKTLWNRENELLGRIPRTCPSYDQFKSIYRTRMKLFALRTELSYVEPKDADKYKAHSYRERLFSRDGSWLLKAFELSRSKFFKAVSIDPQLSSDLRLFALELLRYRSMIESVPDWKEKFDALLAASDKQEKNLVNGAHFHAAGFPVTGNECSHTVSLFTGSGEGLGYDWGNEGWFYSFWVRRYREGTMDATKRILEWIAASLPASQANTPAFTWSPLAAEVRRFVDPGAYVKFVNAGDFDADSLPDVFLVLAKDGRNNPYAMNRLLLLKRNKDMSLTIAGRNDRILICCSGENFRDPLVDIRMQSYPPLVTIVQRSGCTWDTSFEYDSEKNKFLFKNVAVYELSGAGREQPEHIHIDSNDRVRRFRSGHV